MTNEQSRCESERIQSQRQQAVQRSATVDSNAASVESAARNDRCAKTDFRPLAARSRSLVTGLGVGLRAVGGGGWRCADGFATQSAGVRRDAQSLTPRLWAGSAASGALPALAQRCGARALG